MESRRRQATRRLRCLLALAGDYLEYLFLKRRRLLHKVARRTLALVHRHGERRKHHHPWLAEKEFSCADSPSPAFLAARRLLRSSRLRGGGAAAAAGAVSSCFGAFRAPCSGSPETAAVEDEEEEEEDDEQVVVAEEDVWVQSSGELVDVDDRAEEFINMFYEQLRAQSFATIFQRSP